jgi:hypothetical protein
MQVKRDENPRLGSALVPQKLDLVLCSVLPNLHLQFYSNFVLPTFALLNYWLCYQSPFFDVYSDSEWLEDKLLTYLHF